MEKTESNMTLLQGMLFVQSVVLYAISFVSFFFRFFQGHRGTCLTSINWNSKVVEESKIVSEVTFGESASGAAILQGSYVGADQSKSFQVVF